MIPFSFEAPISFFEKADAGAGKTRRIGGVISTESRDRQDEVVVQKGLDFSEFVSHGWFNDNHSKDTVGIVGYPDAVRSIQKGERLPDGRLSPANGTWAEGYMLDTERGQKIWDLGKALQKSGRRLGFSIEGSVERRTGPGRKVIAKARVRNVAITNCPVNTDTRLEVLAKSLAAVARSEDDLSKMLSAGTSVAAPSALGSVSGEGAGRIITPQSLETGKLRKLMGNFDEDEKKRKKKLNKAEAVAWLHERLPHISASTLGRIVDETIRQKI